MSSLSLEGLQRYADPIPGPVADGLINGIPHHSGSNPNVNYYYDVVRAIFEEALLGQGAKKHAERPRSLS